MPKLSWNDYLAKLERIRTAMLRGFTDEEIISQIDAAVPELAEVRQRHRKEVSEVA